VDKDDEHQVEGRIRWHGAMAEQPGKRRAGSGVVMVWTGQLLL